MEEKHWLRPLLKGSLIFLCCFLLLGVTVSYAYLKYVESRVHTDRGLEDEVISEPIGDEPINTLLLGSDARNKKENARSDTIVVFRVVPKEKKVFLVFIPRDMRVKLPGYSYNKINAAAAYGGPKLAITTVEAFTGLPIHHYVKVNFWGFEKMVDALGGINIDVEKPLIDKKTKFGIPAGSQLMDGETALNYVRFRHDAKGDFGRIERQQKFFKALLDQSLQLGSFFKLPTLINIFAENTETDLTTGEMLKLGNFLRSVDKKDVNMVTLPGEAKMINKVSYVIPDDDKIELILSLVKKGSSVGKTLATIEANKSTKVMVLNGCGVDGAAKDVSSKLEAEGFHVVTQANADRYDYKRTVISYHSGAYQKALKIKSLLSGAITEPLDQKIKSSVDIVVTVGKKHKE